MKLDQEGGRHTYMVWWGGYHPSLARQTDTHVHSLHRRRQPSSGKNKHLSLPFLPSWSLGSALGSTWTLPYTLACTAKSSPPGLVVAVVVVFHDPTPSQWEGMSARTGMIQPFAPFWEFAVHFGCTVRSVLALPWLTPTPTTAISEMPTDTYR
jgi:hypothetical protein